MNSSERNVDGGGDTSVQSDANIFKNKLITIDVHNYAIVLVTILDLFYVLQRIAAQHPLSLVGHKIKELLRDQHHILRNLNVRHLDVVEVIHQELAQRACSTAQYEHLNELTLVPQFVTQETQSCNHRSTW